MKVSEVKAKPQRIVECSRLPQYVILLRQAMVVISSLAGVLDGVLAAGVDFLAGVLTGVFAATGVLAGVFTLASTLETWLV
jgi:hypothetical protein